MRRYLKKKLGAIETTRAAPDGVSLSDLMTPSLLLDVDKLDRNIEWMAKQIAGLGCTLRPHVKTNKSLDVTRRVIADLATTKICVSTVKEAKYFFQGGITDITYAVSIVPGKLPAIAELISKGARISVILDSEEMADSVAEFGRQCGITYRVYIELDLHCGRSGVPPDSPVLLNIGRALHGQDGVELAGVLSHAGQSYDTNTVEQIAEIAAYERGMSVMAAESLRQAGLPCREVSIGSSPTARFSKSLEGVTEVRAGVYIFNDLFQAGLGVCDVDDIAVSVLATVIGHNVLSNRLVVDAGWMALSQDRGTSRQRFDQGYGLVEGLNGYRGDDLLVVEANQEHGMVGYRDESCQIDFNKFPIGSRVRILPNHACATAAQHDGYVVVRGQEVLAEWSRVRGW